MTRGRFGGKGEGMCGMRIAVMLLWSVVVCSGCSPYDMRHANQWNSRDQIWLSEASQVKVRAAQTRVFDTTDRRKLLEGVIATMQDVDFRIDVLDEELGIVSGKKYIDLEGPQGAGTSYLLYRSDQLLFMTRNYRSWGPFWNRDDLVRFTVTIRRRGKHNRWSEPAYSTIFVRWKRLKSTNLSSEHLSRRFFFKRKPRRKSSCSIDSSPSHDCWAVVRHRSSSIRASDVSNGTEPKQWLDKHDQTPKPDGRHQGSTPIDRSLRSRTSLTTVEIDRDSAALRSDNWIDPRIEWRPPPVDSCV